jgi:hypothetical protein
MKRYSLVMPGEGLSYDWARDHTFVKVSTADSGGAYTVMEDNLKLEFSLGLHLHHRTAETFYMLDGSVDFYIDGDWMNAGPGATIHIPPGVPHALELAGGTPARMLMVIQPSGFDQLLAEMATMTDAQFADAALMTALNEKYDIINIGGVPAR